VQASVTKSLDILVLADPDSMSGKAKKARQYGTRLVAERVFWGELGVAID
jgi:DNA polymerase-3 subunit epsilon